MLQPYLSTLEENEAVSCKYKFAPIHFPDFPMKDDLKGMMNLYHFFQPNNPTLDYFIDEYNRLIKGKRVLGVLCRGTDYTNSWIPGLPKQPTADDLIKIVASKLDDLECDYIYLATEEETAYKKFCSAFPGKIIQNKRVYYDKRYYKERGEDNKHLLISNVIDDGHYRYLEYLSSINLLSKCNALIAGTCGGSRAALYMNQGQYEYYQLVNLGTF